MAYVITEIMYFKNVHTINVDLNFDQKIIKKERSGTLYKNKIFLLHFIVEETKVTAYCNSDKIFTSKRCWIAHSYILYLYIAALLIWHN